MSQQQPHLLSDRSNIFFEEIYASYSQIWHEVIKIPCFPNTNMISTDSFIQALLNSGIQVNDPYCLFLIDTCSARLDRVQNLAQKKAFDRLTLEERMIDYKLFFDTSIKTKISTFKMPFNDEQFIIDHFWRCKFPVAIVPGLRSPSPELLLMESAPVLPQGGSLDNPMPQKVPLELFNQAFYQFFNRDAQLLEIDQIQSILNECFQYLLRKNKKHISKRTFKAVISRQFKFLFPMILHRYHKLSSDHTKSTDTNNAQSKLLHSADRDIFNKQSVQSDSLFQPVSKLEVTNNNHSQVDCYPDSLDARYPSIQHQQSLDNQVTFSCKALPQNNTLSKVESSKPLEISTHEMDGVFKLFNALTRVKKRLSLCRAYRELKRFTQRRNNVRLLSEDKENQNPSFWQDGVQLQNSKSRSKGQPLLLNKNTSTTFSFNNTANQEEAIQVQQQNYQSHQRLQQYDPYQDEPLFNVTKKNSTGGSHMISKQQSVGSLAFSNTSTKERNFANLSSVKDEASFPVNHSISQQQNQVPIVYNYHQTSAHQEIPFSTKSSLRETQQNLKQAPIQYIVDYSHQHPHLPKENNPHHLQHLLFKPCDSSRFSNDNNNTTIATNHQSSQFQLINDYNAQEQQQVQQQYPQLPPPVMYNGSFRHEECCSRSLGTTGSTRRNTGQFQMPPISSGRLGKRGSSRRQKQNKCSSTPKMITTNHFMKQELMMMRPPYPGGGPGYITVVNRPYTHQFSGGHITSSTIDYSTGTMPESSTTRRPLSHQNRQTLDASHEQLMIEQSSIARSRDDAMNTLPMQTRKHRHRKNTTTTTTMVADPNYYERKYRKSKRRVKKLIAENGIEHSKYEQLSQENLALVSQLEVLQRSQSFNQCALHNHLIATFRKNRLHLRVKTLLHFWRLKTQTHSLLLSHQSSNYQHLHLRLLFQSWRRLSSLRSQQTSHLQRLLKTLHRSHLRSAFTSWSMRTRYSAHLDTLSKERKRRAMLRVVVSLTKMAKVVESRARTVLRDALTRIECCQQQPRQQRKIDDMIGMKRMRARVQERVVEGIERLYPWVKRAEVEKKRRFFQRWRYMAYDAIVGQLDLSNHFDVNTNPNLIFHRVASFNQPSFYKTNEGFFKSEEPRRAIPNTTVIFTPSPNRRKKIGCAVGGCGAEMQISIVNYPNSQEEGCSEMSNNSRERVPPQPHPLPMQRNASGRLGSNSSREEGSVMSYNYPRQVQKQQNQTVILPARLPYHQGNIIPLNRTLQRPHSQNSIETHNNNHRSRSQSADKRQETTYQNTQLNEALAYLKAKVSGLPFKRLV